ncbi:MAG TPA: amidohydrolase family protein [Micropepsaceae bacterium]|jgi:predicted TIM-barrel fold metal-dependent hydrolase|nr:amidohydrolase family protein [Micropepsaceae bacterium]
MGEFGRREFIKGAAFASLAATGAVSMGEAQAQIAVSNSSGTESPKLKAPANAADCHMHIYNPARFPMPPSPRVAPTNAAVDQYRLLQKRIGTTRVVIVTPRNYATQNDATVDAIAQLGSNARGVAVLHPDVSDAELRRLNAAGIRGTRFSLGDPASAVVTPDMIEPLAKKVAPFGWHLQMNVQGEQIVALADVLKRVPTPLVFDHLGNPPLPAGASHPSHAIIRGLIDSGKAWVKLSGAYLNSKVGPPYPEATMIAQDFVKAAPERLVWGSDWPHPTSPGPTKPNDALLFDLLSEWAPSEALQHRILVENPITLYGFARPS